MTSTPQYVQMIITKSSDGVIVSNTVLLPATEPHWSSMSSGNGIIVAVADTGINRSKRSIDGGTSWAVYPTSNDSNEWSSVCYDNSHNLFVAVARTGTNKIMTSSNGENWVGIQSPDETIVGGGNNTWCSVSASNGRLVAVADSGIQTVMTSSDPATAGSWTLRTTPPNDSLQWTSVCAASNMMFVAVGLNASIMSYDNGETWTLSSSTTINASSGIVYDSSNNKLMVFSQPEQNETTFPYQYTESPITYTAGVPSLTWQIVEATLSCYNIGTPILCYINGIETYVLIENIKIGTLVKTLTQGYKPVELIGKHNIINNPAGQITSMYKMKGSNLTLTGGHYLLVDELRDELIHNRTDVTDCFYAHDGKTIIIEGKRPLLVCNSDLFEKLINTSIYTIMHLVLEGNNDNDRYCIYADNVLSESTSKYHFVLNGFQNTG